MSQRPVHITVLVLFIFFCSCPVLAAPPKNVILLIGDGMGFEQVKAAGIYANGEPDSFCFEAFPYRAQVTTYSADSAVTDSAAAATAIATGIKVNNKVISLVIPGDSSELETLLEHAQNLDKATGLVTTAYIAHATPACFGAHQPGRYDYSDIIYDYLNQTKPNILLGGAKYISPSAASIAGYTVVTDYNSMAAIDTNSVQYLSGQFGSDHMPYEYDGVGSLPHLSQMTKTALEILDNEPNGFFLMVEAGRIDHAGHDNHIQRNIMETIEFANSVQQVIDWAAKRTDTLILVTADHETGGLSVVDSNGQGQWPTVTWSATGHTDANVPAYAWGVNAQLVTGTIDNTDFFAIITINEIGSPDLVADNEIDFYDFAILALKWLSHDCNFPYYCQGADFNLSGEVDAIDLDKLSDYRLAE